MSEQHSSNALTRKQIFKFEHVEIYYCHIPLILKKHAWRRRCHFRWTGEGYWNPRPLKFGHPKNFFEWRRSVPKSPNLSKIPKKNWIPTLFVKLYNHQLEAYYTIQILIIQSHLSKTEKKNTLQIILNYNSLAFKYTPVSLFTFTCLFVEKFQDESRRFNWFWRFFWVWQRLWH